MNEFSLTFKLIHAHCTALLTSAKLWNSPFQLQPGRRQSWVWSASDFTFLASAYEGVWLLAGIWTPTILSTVPVPSLDKGGGRRWSSLLSHRVGKQQLTNGLPLGPSIYDVHTEGGWGQAQVDACGRGGVGPAPCGRPQKIKIRVHWRHTVFFSCKEVGVFFYQNFIFGQKKVEIFLRYKLVI